MRGKDRKAIPNGISLCWKAYIDFYYDSYVVGAWFMELAMSGSTRRRNPEERIRRRGSGREVSSSNRGNKFKSCRNSIPSRSSLPENASSPQGRPAGSSNTHKDHFCSKLHQSERQLRMHLKVSLHTCIYDPRTFRSEKCFWSTNISAFFLILNRSIVEGV